LGDCTFRRQSAFRRTVYFWFWYFRGISLTDVNGQTTYANCESTNCKCKLLVTKYPFVKDLHKRISPFSNILCWWYRKILQQAYGVWYPYIVGFNLCFIFLRQYLRSFGHVLARTRFIFLVKRILWYGLQLLFVKFLNVKVKNALPTQ
jgi:hypothetical protein